MRINYNNGYYIITCWNCKWFRIEIQSGTTTIKAIAISDIGVCSDVVELEYTVDFKKPSAPTVGPASGTYEEGQTVTIDNIPVGSTAYYTLDGSTPTKNSEEFSLLFHPF